MRYLIEDRGYDTPCWVWQEGLSTDGYGMVWFAGRRYGAHRAIYQLLKGLVYADKELDHLCRVRACVNPAHLEPVSHRENCLRGAGPIPINAAKTHCANGHEFSEENTYHRPRGGRDCRQCIRDKQRTYRAKKRAQAA